MSGETKQQISTLMAENAFLKKVVADVAQKPTLRDKFAMAALGRISGPTEKIIAKKAYAVADAMLKERDNEQA
jgi:hypothetical protein